jgi:hypothetical protein
VKPGAGGQERSGPSSADGSSRRAPPPSPSTVPTIRESQSGEPVIVPRAAATPSRFVKVGNRRRLPGPALPQRLPLESRNPRPHDGGDMWMIKSRLQRGPRPACGPLPPAMILSVSKHRGSEVSHIPFSIHDQKGGSSYTQLSTFQEDESDIHTPSPRELSRRRISQVRITSISPTMDTPGMLRG